MATIEEDYPEHVKMMAVRDQSQAIGEFLDNSRYVLAVPDRHDRLQGVSTPINQILANYFGIDLDKIEEEKRAMIASLGGGV